MAVVIRLARFGSTKVPKYRITVADSRRFRDSRFIEVIGHYIPQPKGKDVALKIDMERVNEWTKKGARLTDRVRSLIRNAAKYTAQPAQAK